MLRPDLFLSIFFRSVCLLASLFAVGHAQADLTVGPLADFNDGTLQGWETPNGNTSNPSGTYLEVRSEPNMAAFSDAVAGVIDDDVLAIKVDLMRPADDSDIELRMVYRGGPNGNDSWTSTISQTVFGDGIWRTYLFSALEEDMTQVEGPNNFIDMMNNLDKLMFRVDPDEPSGSGFWVPGTFGMDNVFAIGSSDVGDYNGDGMVDAADYTVWRDSRGTVYDDDDYDVWSDNYGVATLSSQNAIPEPSAVVLLFVGLTAGLRRRRNLSSD